ncbi:MAG TPA: hypothetical protein VGR62_08465 [Candidatus Binatia bacterium]|jgi:hypothetical protein|nr:hypothetical protein [Candidatus Binatia bacterium]
MTPAQRTAVRRNGIVMAAAAGAAVLTAALNAFVVQAETRALKYVFAAVFWGACLVEACAIAKHWRLMWQGLGQRDDHPESN